MSIVVTLRPDYAQEIAKVRPIIQIIHFEKDNFRIMQLFFSSSFVEYGNHPSIEWEIIIDCYNEKNTHFFILYPINVTFPMNPVINGEIQFD